MPSESWRQLGRDAAFFEILCGGTRKVESFENNEYISIQDLNHSPEGCGSARNSGENAVIWNAMFPSCNAIRCAVPARRQEQQIHPGWNFTGRNPSNGVLEPGDAIAGRGCLGRLRLSFPPQRRAGRRVGAKMIQPQRQVRKDRETCGANGQGSKLQAAQPARKMRETALLSKRGPMKSDEIADLTSDHGVVILVPAFSISVPMLVARDLTFGWMAEKTTRPRPTTAAVRTTQSTVTAPDSSLMKFMNIAIILSKGASIYSLNRFGHTSIWRHTIPTPFGMPLYAPQIVAAVGTRRGLLQNLRRRPERRVKGLIIKITFLHGILTTLPQGVVFQSILAKMP
jgi:hypothetical protein